MVPLMVLLETKAYSRLSFTKRRAYAQKAYAVSCRNGFGGERGAWLCRRETQIKVQDDDRLSIQA